MSKIFGTHKRWNTRPFLAICVSQSNELLSYRIVSQVGKCREVMPHLPINTRSSEANKQTLALQCNITFTRKQIFVFPTNNLQATLERETGIEPATFSLARRCSTTEPLPR